MVFATCLINVNIFKTNKHRKMLITAFDCLRKTVYFLFKIDNLAKIVQVYYVYVNFKEFS